jgi:hypothetical protein
MNPDWRKPVGVLFCCAFTGLRTLRSLISVLP